MACFSAVQVLDARELLGNWAEEVPLVAADVFEHCDGPVGHLAGE